MTSTQVLAGAPFKPAPARVESASGRHAHTRAHKGAQTAPQGRPRVIGPTALSQAATEAHTGSMYPSTRIRADTARVTHDTARVTCDILY